MRRVAAAGRGPAHHCCLVSRLLRRRSDVFRGASKAGGRIEPVKRQDGGDNLRMRGGDWRGGR